MSIKRYKKFQAPGTAPATTNLGQKNVRNNSSISYSQSRVQVAWHTLIRPDGYVISLGNMADTDAQGAAGLKGLVNDHPFQYLKAIALMSVFNIISSEFENTAAGTDNQYVSSIHDPYRSPQICPIRPSARLYRWANTCFSHCMIAGSSSPFAGLI
jgi:hypothetical protein